MSRPIFGMNCSCSSNVGTPGEEQVPCYKIIILHHMVVFLGVSKQQQRCSSVASIGLLSARNEFVLHCDLCQRTDNFSHRHEMPLQNILKVKILMHEIFTSWGRPFLISIVNTSLLGWIMSLKWVETVAYSLIMQRW